jgi:uncharacterized phage protein (TIGR01671 family)
MKREIKFRAWGDFGKKMHFQTKEEDLWSFLRDAYGMELMQYTGLKDKNGKEIYEGDIVKPVKFNDIINTVEYISHGFYRVKRHNGKPYLNALGSCDVIIIGNIYENPTLIK